MPPLSDGDNDDYDDGDEDKGEGETSEERATILLCVFRDFCRPPRRSGVRRPRFAGGSDALAGDATGV